MLVDALVKGGLARPVKKIGLWFAGIWPWPIKASLAEGGVKMWVDLRSSVGRAILVKGEFDPGVWRNIEPDLPADGVFIDVGANVGYYSMLAAKKVTSTGRVYAFEIDPRPLRCIRRNVAECNERNIDLYEIAVGDKVGNSVLLAGNDSGHSSVADVGDGLTVAMTTLDDWLENRSLDRIDVIKIDIEGGELKALYGSKALLKRFKPVVVLEADKVDATELESFFTELDYSVAQVEKVHNLTILARAKSN